MPAPHPTPWRLQAHRASLESGEFRAEIDLAMPALGLRVAAARSPAPVGSLLGIGLPPDSATAGHRCAEATIRGQDLLAAYEPTAGWPIHVDALWRALWPSPDDRFLAGIDLVVSVRTDLLDVRPRLAVQSAVAATAEPLLLDRGGRAGCVLLRTTVEGLSYAEMVHPGDFQENQWQAATRRDDAGAIVHCLSLERLERGVIVRAWVRGLLLARSDDASIAAACYAAFAASEPPLGA